MTIGGVIIPKPKVKAIVTSIAIPLSAPALGADVLRKAEKNKKVTHKLYPASDYFNDNVKKCPNGGADAPCMVALMKCKECNCSGNGYGGSCPFCGGNESKSF